MKKGQTRKPDTLKEPAQISTKVKQENKSLEKCWPVGGNQTLYESWRNENQTLYESRRNENQTLYERWRNENQTLYESRRNENQTLYESRRNETKPSTRDGATWRNQYL
jgi:hypothetical protein